MTELVQVVVRDAIALITLNRHERRNAMSRELLGLLREALAAAPGEGAGVVSEVHPEDGYLEAALELARHASANDCAAMTATKGLLNALDGNGVDAAQWQVERAELLASPQRRAAVLKAQDRLKSPG